MEEKLLRNEVMMKSIDQSLAFLMSDVNEIRLSLLNISAANTIDITAIKADMTKLNKKLDSLEKRIKTFEKSFIDLCTPR